MEFIPAGEIIGNDHQVRTVAIALNPHIFGGEYRFIDTYCSESGCDCRKSMIQVLHNDKLVSIINYGWESAAFYKNWMKSDENDATMPSMTGASVDISSPNLVDPAGVLSLFNALLDDNWAAKFKLHYKKFKSVINKRSK